MIALPPLKPDEEASYMVPSAALVAAVVRYLDAMDAQRDNDEEDDEEEAGKQYSTVDVGPQKGPFLTHPRKRVTGWHKGEYNDSNRPAATRDCPLSKRPIRRSG